MTVYFLLGDVSAFNVYNNNLYIIYGTGFEFAKKRLSTPETIAYIEKVIRETINRSFSIKIIFFILHTLYICLAKMAVPLAASC